MKLYRKLEDVPNSIHGGALTIGNFDGVHRGHSRIIDRLKFHASQNAGPSIVFTFDPHPVRLLRPEQTPPPLTWTNRKAELLSELGVDAMVAYPTNEEFLKLSAPEFFDRVIIQAIGARAMVEGPNFYFGRNREGDVNALSDLCAKAKVHLEIVEPLKEESEYISSSRIRGLLKHGNVGPAREMLTRPYRIRGMVTHGAARGAQIGFPTANLDAIETLIPADGVYAGRADVGGRSFMAAINIGSNPTFKESTPKVEIHLLGFSDSIYGQVIEVDFIERLRDIRAFDSVEMLKEQLVMDVENVRSIVSQY